eukprot:sb/3476917/
MIIQYSGEHGTGVKTYDKGSYLLFLVGMATCLLVAKLIVLFLKLLELHPKIPYFSVFNLFLSLGMVFLLFIACIMGSVAAHNHTLNAGVAFGWMSLGCLMVEVFLCWRELRKH